MNETNDTKAKGVVVTIVGTDADELRFCRRLSADVNHGPLYLSQVMCMGRQIYPFHNPILGRPEMLLRCEFRMRNVSASLSRDHFEGLLGRLANYQVIEAHAIEAGGAVGERLDLPVAIG